jgi:hypothetical protein
MSLQCLNPPAIVDGHNVAHGNKAQVEPFVEGVTKFVAKFVLNGHHNLHTITGTKKLLV